MFYAENKSAGQRSCLLAELEYTQRYLRQMMQVIGGQVQREERAIIALTNVKHKLDELRSIQIPMIISRKNRRPSKYLLISHSDH